MTAISLEGHVALVTGSGRGLGAAYARELARSRRGGRRQRSARKRRRGGGGVRHRKEWRPCRRRVRERRHSRRSPARGRRGRRAVRVRGHRDQQRRHHPAGAVRGSRRRSHRRRPGRARQGHVLRHPTGVRGDARTRLRTDREHHVQQLLRRRGHGELLHGEGRGPRLQRRSGARSGPPRRAGEQRDAQCRHAHGRRSHGRGSDPPARREPGLPPARTAHWVTVPNPTGPPRS